ncbi:HAD family hydrolase [Luteipulveratus mongoliensis]|uniref:Haloacid dehalogenase n=1 Tax=Luteipulveratus mongoliensis TaxID=571913 RepID=A0A0K1JJ40_9MICO|nr:HAD-IA family hydrolase [Luteipulveratus mongoliensis]AKU16729.1 haloacid dehalogenase [Luteipulveratus mongoliensis]
MSESQHESVEAPFALDLQDDIAPNPVDAVVFDLGNVLIRWDPVPAIAAAVGQERAEAFVADPAFDFTAWNHAQDAGRRWDEGEQLALRSHPHLEQEIRSYRSNFGASLLGEVEDTVAILRELHQAKVPLFALTNWSEELFPKALDRFDFLDVFEDIIVSGEEEVAKPDPEIFEVLGERIRHVGGLDDCVFIDDSEANVQAATAAGLDAILFTDTGHLREDLIVRGLPLQPRR